MVRRRGSFNRQVRTEREASGEVSFNAPPSTSAVRPACACIHAMHMPCA